MSFKGMTNPQLTAEISLDSRKLILRKNVLVSKVLLTLNFVLPSSVVISTQGIPEDSATLHGDLDSLFPFSLTVDFVK